MTGMRKKPQNKTWSVRTAEEHFFSMLLPYAEDSEKELVESEMKELTASYQMISWSSSKIQILEFLGFFSEYRFYRVTLRKVFFQFAEMLMELGKGICFWWQDSSIFIREKQDYYIDLVFYNYILKNALSFIDLKMRR